MYAYINKVKRKAVADRVSQSNGYERQNPGSVGQYPQLVAQKKLQNITNNRHQPAQLGKLPRKNRRTMSVHDREARREAGYSATTGGGTTEFNNNEGKLPKASKGTHYIETDSGRGREDRGARRIVSLVKDNSGQVIRRYITYDHYRTFKEMR